MSKYWTTIKQFPHSRNSYSHHQVDKNCLEYINSDFSFSSRFISKIEDRIKTDGFIVANLKDIYSTVVEFQSRLSVFARSLGCPMVQNHLGDTLVEVFDRDIGRIEDGVRYHQTRQGGDIHTDSVNRPQPIRYLLLGCATPALIGGESILVRADDVYRELEHFPDVQALLSREFFFEGRGMSSDTSLFRLPVLSVAEGKPRFRYLRSYIESAHRKAGAPLSQQQVRAFDALDALLETSALQFRIALGPGDVLITDDTAVFHGRTGFVDRIQADAVDCRRRMLRIWVD